MLSSIYLSSAFNVFLSGVAGLVLYKMIVAKHALTTPIDYSRKWLATTIFIVSLASLPEFFRDYNAEPLARWVAGILFFGLIAFISGFIYGKIKGKPEALSNTNVVADNNKKEKDTMNVKVDDTTFYEIAWSEIEGNKLNKALWSKAFAECEGDENKSKAMYIKLRTNQLTDEENSKVETEALKRNEELKNRTEEELMSEYGITLDGDKYCFSSYSYENLNDAINYAKISINRPT